MITIEEKNRLIGLAKELRKGVIECVGVGTAGHIGGSFSSADMVAALYFHKMKIDPENPTWRERDRFILSKGHVAVLQYAALAVSGFFPRELLKTCKDIGSILQGHPDRLKTPGIEVGTGSLGQGLSLGLGMALANRLDGIDSDVYVLMGDGEICEGQIWEAAMAASAYKLNHLIGIVDNNCLQATGRICDRMDYGSITEKWKSFGWNVVEVDGHDFDDICEVLDHLGEEKERPTLIVAHTVKGKGLSFAENVVGFHNGKLTKEQYDQAMEELR